MAENIWDPNPPPKETPPDDNDNKLWGNMAIVGWNLLALAIYTLALKFASDGAGFIFDALILFFHVSFCLVMSFGIKTWYWLLSAALVLAIGFSTCVNFLGK